MKDLTKLDEQTFCAAYRYYEFGSSSLLVPEKDRHRCFALLELLFEPERKRRELRRADVEKAAKLSDLDGNQLSAIMAALPAACDACKTPRKKTDAAAKQDA